MATGDIRAADGDLFTRGTYLGKVNPDGEVFDDKGAYVGRITEDGRFMTRSGLYSEREEFIVADDGTVYDGKGLYTYGRKLGSISTDGTVRSPEGIPLATIERESPKNNVGRGDGFQVGGFSGILVLLVAFFGIFAIWCFISLPYALSSTTYTFAQKAAVVGCVVASIGAAGIFAFVKRDSGSEKFSENFAVCFPIVWLTSIAVYFFSSWVYDGGYEGLTIVLMLLGTAALTLVHSALSAAAASLLVTSYAKRD